MTRPFTKCQLQYGLDLIFGAKEGLANAIDLAQAYDEKEEKTVLTTSEPLG